LNVFAYLLVAIASPDTSGNITNAVAFARVTSKNATTQPLHLTRPSATLTTLTVTGSGTHAAAVALLLHLTAALLTLSLLTSSITRTPAIVFARQAKMDVA